MKLKHYCTLLKRTMLVHLEVEYSEFVTENVIIFDLLSDYFRICYD